MSDKYAFLKSSLMPYAFAKTFPALSHNHCSRLLHTYPQKTETISMEPGTKVEILMITQSIVSTNSTNNRHAAIYVKKTPSGNTITARYGSTPNSNFGDFARKMYLYSVYTKLNIDTASLSYKAYLYDKCAVETVALPENMTPLSTGQFAPNASLYMTLVPETSFSNTPYSTEETPYASQHLLIELTNDSTSTVVLTHTQNAFGEISLPIDYTRTTIAPHVPIEFCQYVFAQLRKKYAVMLLQDSQIASVSTALHQDIKNALRIISSGWLKMTSDVPGRNGKLINFMLFYLDYFNNVK